VLAYNKDPKPQVTLVEGKVAVSKTIGNIQEHLADLEPNQNLIYDTILQKVRVDETDLYAHIAWKDGKLIFRNEPLVNVLKRIGILYNVHFELRGKEFLEYRYRATFQEEKLEDILKILKATSPIDYKIIERKPLPDGTFPPRKVSISIKR
jgi:ferric-dicitrate binding protein FerR (iron transport regulator)